MMTKLLSLKSPKNGGAFIVFLWIAVLGMGTLVSVPGWAQDDESGPPKPPPTFIELTSVKVNKVKDNWQLRVAGKATDLPQGVSSISRFAGELLYCTTSRSPLMDLAGLMKRSTSKGLSVPSVAHS